MPRLVIGRGEILLVLISLAFQFVSLITLLRVATGVAATNPSQASNSTGPIVIPRNLNQSVTIPNSTPQFVSPFGSNISESLILVLLFVGANVVVIGFLAFLYRKRRMKWFSLLISLFLVFNVTELYFTFLTGLSSWIPIVSSFVALAITIVAALRGSSLVTNIIALVLALELGSSFPVLLPSPLNWIIPLVYALFDVYAVYYGRLGKLVRDVAVGQSSAPVSPAAAQRPRGRLSKWPDFGLLSVNLGSIEIGMADIAFYTMVPAVALILNSLIAFLVVMAAVDVGILVSFTIFQKREVSPGLPVPILFGLGALFVMSFIIR